MKEETVSGSLRLVAKLHYTQEDKPFIQRCGSQNIELVKELN
jgi:hypothetical protein